VRMTFYHFFFQAEDGIRDWSVTGVQTCALPIFYVVSSHFDSVEAGPGADDDSSGTAALLETARVLRDHPLPATVIFASFTGEERSEERRVGKEGRTRCGAAQDNEKTDGGGASMG